MSAAITVMMACRNAGPYLGAALESVRAQTFSDLDILVVDDGSVDDSRAIAEKHAVADGRVRVVDNVGRGVSAARNTALAQARGAFIATVDCDDLIHPTRMEKLLAAAEARQADLIADNLIVFWSGERKAAPFLFVAEPGFDEAREIDLATFLESSIPGRGRASLGYLKPLMRRSAVGASRYDPSLTIGEDQDFFGRLMAQGARFSYIPAPLYCYRKHAASISHRLKPSDLDALIAADASFRAGLDPGSKAHAMSIRRSAAWLIERNVVATLSALKARRVLEAAGLILARPDCAPRLAAQLAEGLSKRVRGARLPRPQQRAAGDGLQARQQTLIEAAFAAALTEAPPDPALEGYDALLRACLNSAA